MPRELHEKMVEVCKLQLRQPFTTDGDIRHLSLLPQDKPRSIPDLSIRNEFAIECMAPVPGALDRLRKYRQDFTRLTIVIPTPGHIDEIWLFNMESNNIYRRLLV